MASKGQITFEIQKHIGVLSEGSRGWRRELNIVSWNGNAPKYDIRDWDESHERMSKGIALTKEELEAIVELMSKEA